MKYLKKYLPLALAAILVLGISIPALAAVEDTGFSDVDANAVVCGGRHILPGAWTDARNLQHDF